MDWESGNITLDFDRDSETGKRRKMLYNIELREISV
jgi:hypothetical protein